MNDEHRVTQRSSCQESSQIDEPSASHTVSAFQHSQSLNERQRGRLEFLLNAESLQDVGVMPGWRLVQLRGDRQGLWSIRINDQWRICFVWDDSMRQAFEIEIVNYRSNIEPTEETERKASVCNCANAGRFILAKSLPRTCSWN